MQIFLDANICLDLLDTTRPTSKQTVQWYMQNKDDQDIEFYFSGDFISTFYYILTQKRKLEPSLVINAIDALSCEIIPIYLIHSDFQHSKSNFFEDIFSDFEDLMILNSALRVKSDIFITNDKEILKLETFKTINITSPY